MCFIEEAILQFIEQQKNNILTNEETKNYITTLVNEICQTNNKKEQEENKSLLMNRYAATADQSMDDLINFGIYGWTYGTKPFDCPVNDTGIMLVFQYSKTSKAEYGRIVQILFTVYGMFSRYRTTTAWTEWTCPTMLQSADGLKLRATANKCNSHFIPLKDVDTSSKATPTFLAGQGYHGVPYSARHYDSLDVFYNSTLDNLFSMMNNSATEIYNYTNTNGTGDVYSGAVCSSFVSWVCNLPIYYTTYDIMKMLNYKTINDVEDIEIGDVLLCHTSWGDNDNHSMIVSGILTDVSGISAVEVSEMWNPLFKKSLYSREQFMGLLNGATRKGQKYRVGRFDNHSIRTSKPIEINSVLMTEKGNKVFYELGEDIWVTIPKNGKLVITKDGNSEVKNVSSLPVKRDGLCNIKTFINDIGEWIITNSEETKEKCVIKIIKKGTARLESGRVVLSGYSECAPCGFAVVGIRQGGTGLYKSYKDGCTATRLTIESKENPKYAGTISSDVFQIDDRKIKNPYIGYYVRIFYDTGFGQAYQDTNVLMF